MEYTIQAIPQDEQGVAFHLASYKPFRLRALRTDPSAFSSTYEREITYDDEKWRSRLMNPLVKTLVALPNPSPEGNTGHHPDPAVVEAVRVRVPVPVPVPILSATTVVGPLPPSDALTEYLASTTRIQTETKTDASTDDTGTSRPPQVWAINAVWTAPEARRKGIASHLMREAIHHIQEQAQARFRRRRQSQPQPQAQENPSTIPQEGAGPAAAAAAAQETPPELYLDVGVEKNNEPAIALYKRSGFIPYSEDSGDIVQGGSTRRKEFINMYLPVEYPALD